MVRLGHFLCFSGFVLGLLLAYVRPAVAADAAGTRRYNYVTKKYEFYDGSDWYNFNLGLPLGFCTKEGEFDFDTLLSTYKYCNGTNWIRLIGGLTLMGCSPIAKMDYFSNSYYFCNGLVWMNLKGPLVL